MSFDEPGIMAITLSLVSAAAALSLMTVTIGLLSTLTGKDPLPTRIRRLLRRVPASAEDFRLRGVGLLLGGAAVMLLVAIITANVVVMSMLSPGIVYLAPSAPTAFPKETVFLVNTVAALTAIACFIAAYSLGVRVRYVSTRASTGAEPQMPPAQG